VKLKLILVISNLRSLIFGLVLVTFAPAALGTIITYNFTGTVAQRTADGIFAGQGNAVTGTISFDDGVQDLEPDSNFDSFNADGDSEPPNINEPFLSSFSAELTIGEVTVNITANLYSELTFTQGEGEFIEFIEYQVHNQTGSIRAFFEFEAEINAEPVNGELWNLDGTIGTAITILDGLNLDAYDNAEVNWLIEDDEVRVGFLAFRMTSLSLAFPPVPEPTLITIDIKPGSPENTINISSSGVIPVAILGSATLDVTTINPDTIALAGASVMMVGKSDKYLCNQHDINADTYNDLVCNVYTAGFMIEEGETSATLDAETFDGELLRGEDLVRIVPD